MGHYDLAYEHLEEEYLKKYKARRAKQLKHVDDVVKKHGIAEALVRIAEGNLFNGI